MNALQIFSKTRIAPTPSGFLHLGNVFSFAITAALADGMNADVLLRIDDLDQERTAQHYVEDIFDTLHYLGINFTEGPRNFGEYKNQWSQLHRLPLYNEALEQLRPHVFACNCSRTQISRLSADGAYPGTCRHKHIPLDEPGVAWRLYTDSEQTLTVRTISGQFIHSTLPSQMKDFIVRKKDGFPAYQLTSVLDDVHFGINGIVRGGDLWSSTLAQLYLSALLPGNPLAAGVFYHHPLLLETGGQKMSKSAGATSIQFLRNAGESPQALYTMIAGMLGLAGKVRNHLELAAALPAV